jgi:hypothetical protein
MRIMLLTAALMAAVETDAGAGAGQQSALDDPGRGDSTTALNPAGAQGADQDCGAGQASNPTQAFATLVERVSTLEGVVDAIEHARSQAIATAAAATPAPAPRPSLGRVVIARYPHRQDAPAMVTFVHSDTVVDLQIFRGDHLPHNGQQVAQIDPANTDGTGWFWPPRA